MLKSKQLEILISLEEEADLLLADFLKNKKKNKMRTEEYPFLSNSQIRRRHGKEIPVSNLSKGQSLDARGKGIESSDLNLLNE